MVHTFFPASNALGIIIARLAGVRKLISTRRDLGFNLTRKDIKLLKLANRFASCVLTNSKAVARNVMRQESVSSEKLRVIYNGIATVNSGL